MPNRQFTREKLARAQHGLLKAADAIPASAWETPPFATSWSAAQVIAHLCQVERSVVGYADRVTRNPPRPIPVLKRIHFPLALVELRIIRRKTPVPLDPELLAEKETMLADLRAVRERTLAFLEEMHGRDLRAYYWPHPFLGMLNFYDWFTMVAAHQIRHTKQIVDLAKNLPKRVVTS